MPERAADLPEWISPPGEIVAKVLDSRQMDIDEFACSLGFNVREALALLEGSMEIDDALAAELARVIGSTSSFWLRCEQNYQEDLRRNLPAYVDDQAREWLGRLPLKEMSRLGWLKTHKDPILQAQECFRFFGVMGFDEWRERQTALLSKVNFRTSTVFSADTSATSAWLRWAETKAEEISCCPWNRDSFLGALSAIRGLSRNHHPEWFVPRLREMCAAHGVALVIAPAPKGCRASGATKLLRPKKAMLVLSFRYYSDDHFWFSFFHEAAHLILHADQSLFLDEDGGELDDREAEANSFAYSTLIPADKEMAMVNLPRNYKAYVEFGRELGIAPGIIVGQMQRLGHLPYKWLNQLKRRFDWDDLYAAKIIP